MILFNYSKQVIKPATNSASFITGQIEITMILFYQWSYFAIQSKENNPKQESDVRLDEPSILQKYQQHSLEFHLDFLLNAPQIILPLNSYSNEAILCDLGKLTMNSTLDEQHRITFENLEINRIVLNSSLNLFECLPFVTLINRHLNSENNN